MTDDPSRARTGRVAAVVVAILAVSGAFLAFWLIAAQPDKAEVAVEKFFDRYVARDGQVMRRDQEDTVSEGQAYALLMAVALGDEQRFSRVWAWTRTHLQRPDGLLSWRWADGLVRDPQPAADADIDTVHALLLAAERFGEPAYRLEALRIARSIREHETIVAGGQPVLVAGPWAIRNQVFVINPSYFHTRAFQQLGVATDDPWWHRLTASSYDLSQALLGDHVLPPDWAIIDSEGIVSPTGSPDEPDRPARYGLDAARVPVRFVFACDPRGRALAASLWSAFQNVPPEAIRTEYDLGGTPTTQRRHPVTLVAAAAVARAAGDRPRAAQLLNEAEALDERMPSYYGSAWVALGHIMLTSDRLGDCE
jgi:endo-1,4-beta-D-glucanase Y